MRTGRLLLTVYLGAIVVVFVVGGIVVAVATFGGFPVRDVEPVSRHVVQDLARWRHDPVRLRAESRDLERRIVAVSLYTPDGRLLVSTVDPPLPYARVQTGPREDGEFVHQIEEDGRVVAVGVTRFKRPSLSSALIGLAILLGGLTLAVLVIARYVGGPLQRIADAARRIGRGELTARAGITRRDELGEVGRAFDDMADRVAQLMHAQRELMANVSHELQTPLARIHVAMALLLDGVKTADVKQLLPEISGDLAELERLIEDVMTVSRLDLAQSVGRSIGTPLRIQPTELRSLVQDAAARFRGFHPNRHLAVSLTGELPVLPLDTVLVRRAVDNLLENARKYSEADTTVELRAKPTDGGGVVITVIDRGIGIDAADVERVFEPFFRTDRSRDRTTGGAGLGLALARRVVEAHRGSIRIISEPHVGTTVRIELPPG